MSYRANPVGETPIMAASCLLLLFLFAFVSVATADARPEQEGCRFKTVVDYGQPLREMRPIHRPPRSEGQVPFAPRGVTVRVPVPTVTEGGGKIGLELSGRSVTLNWTVVSTLNRVRRSGAVAEILSSKRQRIGSLQSGQPARPSLLFAVSNHPAFYRVDSIFFDASGHRLGEYAEYFRILKHRTEFRQSVSPRMIHRGETLVARTEDLGTTGLSFGMAFAIDRFEEGEWKLNPLTPKGFPGIGYYMFGGGTYECNWLRLPIDLAPGHYRYRKNVEVFPHRTHSIAADFFVVP